MFCTLPIESEMTFSWNYGQIELKSCCPLAEWLTANSFDLLFGLFTIIRLFVANESMVKLLTFDKKATVSEIFMESSMDQDSWGFWLPLSKNLDPGLELRRFSMYSKASKVNFKIGTQHKKAALAHHKWYDNDSSSKA